MGPSFTSEIRSDRTHPHTAAAAAAAIIMEATIHRFSSRILTVTAVETLIRSSSNGKTLRFPRHAFAGGFHRNRDFTPDATPGPIPVPMPHSSPSSRRPSRVVGSAGGGWFLEGLGVGGKKKEAQPEIVKAGDPVLHEPARDIAVEEIGSEKIERIINDMVRVMRRAPGVGLAAPQIGVPLKIIVLEDTKEYISYAPKNEIKAQDRRPFDLLVILNPKLEKKSNKTALFFEGCLSVDGFRAMVERYLEVEVTGLGRDGHPVKVNATGWQARILQHEYDHLDGTIYVDKMVPRTFRTVQNLDMPLPTGCPKLGAC